MSYIGKTPTVGNFIKLDDITTSSTNSYTLQHNSVNFSPESSLHMMVSLNGVIQSPNTSYTVSGSTITFLPSSGTLSSSDSIDFIMVYGNVLDVGVASSVADSSITKGKLNLISDSSSAGLTVKGDGSSENGTLQLNCSQNSHGVKISSPAHSAGQSYELILPTGNVTADKVLKVASVSGSGATGIGQLSFGDAGGANTPYFYARLGSEQSGIGASVQTKATFNIEDFDTGGEYDNSSNYRFTPANGNTYLLHSVIIMTGSSNTLLQEASIILKKNGSEVFSTRNDTYNNNSNVMSPSLSKIVTGNGSDYYEIFGSPHVSSGTGKFKTGSFFTAFKLIG